jgi:hypothetical protein
MAQIGQRREGERGRPFKIAGHDEAAGRQGGERAGVRLAGLEIGGEKLRQFAGSGFVGGRLRVDRSGAGKPVLGEIGAGAGAGKLHGIGAEFAEILRQQRQIEQPFAGIIDDVDRQLAGG